MEPFHFDLAPAPASKDGGSGSGSGSSTVVQNVLLYTKIRKCSLPNLPGLVFFTERHSMSDQGQSNL